MNVTNTLRILVVDDHVLFRKGLGLLMSSRNDMKIVGEAGDGQDAITMARETHPDMILMDVHMPGYDGIQAVSAIKKEMPNIKIVMLSASDDDDDLFAAIKSGADGYLLKDIDPPKFFKLIQNVRHGEAPISGILANRILKEFRERSTDQDFLCKNAEHLTPKEIQTLELLVVGASNREIADKMHLSESTVKLHLRNIMEKLHLRNRVQIAVYAMRHGIMPPTSTL